MSDPCARNLLPNPKPTDTADWAFYTGKDIRLKMLSDNRLHITNQNGTPNSYIYTQMTLPAGTYRFGAEASDAQYGYEPNLLRMVVVPKNELASAPWLGSAGRYVTPANTVDSESVVEFRVMVGPNKNSAVWVRQLFVMTEEDYQHMLSSDITWFDGDSIVPGGGFHLGACIHMWITAMLWWWSHEQHRTAEYVHATVSAVQAQCLECVIRTARQWPMAVQGRWQLRAWHGARGDQIDRSGCGRRARPRLRMRRAYTARWVEFGLSVLHAWLRLAARRHSVRPDWLERVPDHGHDLSQPRILHPPRRGLGHNPRVRELHGRGLDAYRGATRQRHTADRMVRATTGRHDRANIPTSAHTLTAISQWEMVA